MHSFPKPETVPYIYIVFIVIIYIFISTKKDKQSFNNHHLRSLSFHFISLLSKPIAASSHFTSCHQVHVLPRALRHGQEESKTRTDDQMTAYWRQVRFYLAVLESALCCCHHVSPCQDCFRHCCISSPVSIVLSLCQLYIVDTIGISRALQSTSLVAYQVNALEVNFLHFLPLQFCNCTDLIVLQDFSTCAAFTLSSTFEDLLDRNGCSNASTQLYFYHRDFMFIAVADH